MQQHWRRGLAVDQAMKGGQRNTRRIRQRDDEETKGDREKGRVRVVEKEGGS